MAPNGGTDTTPIWSDPSTAVCGTCHGATAANPPTRGSHGKHASNYFDAYSYPCGLCHKDPATDDSLHVNNKSEVIFSADPKTTGGRYSGTQTMLDAYGTCTNIYCHSTVQSSPPGGPPTYRTTPTWGNNGTVMCGSCHKHDGSHMFDANIMDSGSHTRHLSYDLNTSGAKPFKCVICHKWNASAGLRDCDQCHTVKAAKHANSSIDINFDSTFATNGTYNGSPTPVSKSPGAAYGNCSNTYCHSNGTSVSTGAISNNTSPTWGTGSLTCNACHSYPPDYSNGSPKANSHQAHANAGITCDKCHNATTTDGSTVTNTTNHVNKAYDLQPGSGVSFIYTFNASGGACASISCHGNTDATWGISNCLGCHSVSQGKRAAITPQFSANSHHIQGTVSNNKCYQCHWEANSDGTINRAWFVLGTGQLQTFIPAHGSGSTVNLVIYGSGARPTTYELDTTAIQYAANGSRAQIASINAHCLGCHSDKNNTTTPFGDGKTPKQYAWDGNSVDARYSQTGTTPWGKYSSTTYPNVTPKDKSTKAFSAHGNAVNNQGGWDLNETWPNARTGSENVACYDCHNSHGSSVLGTTTSYTSATTSGGILKDTTAGKGGYSVTYQPQAGGSATDKNLRNAGASLCFDCHLTQSAGTTPWGYNSTFGESQAVIGYFDSPYLAPGGAGVQQRYSYKALSMNAGGHFGASSPLSKTPLLQINGLCASCHDPHGVSPTDVGSCSSAAYVTKSTCQSGGGVWTATPQYGVPMLKGTWMTSPYKEDAAPANNAKGTVRDSTHPLGYDATPREGVQYHIDQNTFGANIKSTVSGVTETANQFAGLCLKCHPKVNLTDGINGGTWKSVDRIHESVKGWGANVRHNYTCSKCHASHNGSALPRLMITNCLNKEHKGRVGYNPSPALSGYGYGDDVGCYGDSVTLGGCPTYPAGSYNFSSGGGRFPGSFDGYYFSDHYGSNAFTVSCHENETGSITDQSWNVKTPWVDQAPSITSGPSAVIGNQMVLMHMDEAAWNGTPNEVEDSSGGNNNGSAYNGANTVAGGVSGRAGSFNGTDNYVRINYSPPVDNFTIEAWIKPTAAHEIDAESNSGTSGTSGQRYLFGADHRGTEGGAGISAGTNGISVYEHGDNYMPALAVYSGSISTTQWTHMAVVYSNRQPSIYLNGVLVRAGLQSTKAHVYAPTQIGGGSYGYFPGTVDDVAIYDGALSAADILLHYQRNSSAVCNMSEANIIWTTDFDATSDVDYGLTASYGSTAGNGSLVKNHSVILSGLSAPATYHYRVRSSNTDGETASGDYTFNVNACP